MSAGFLKQGTSLWLAQPKTLLAAFSLLAAFWMVSSNPFISEGIPALDEGTNEYLFNQWMRFGGDVDHSLKSGFLLLEDLKLTLEKIKTFQPLSS